MVYIMHIVLFVWSLCLLMVTSYPKNRQIIETNKVAYLFAGSARSFIIPTVYKSIDRNLIQSFCPSYLNCSYDIFMYVSAMDNVVNGFDATGTFVQAEEGVHDDIMRAIDYMKPDNSTSNRIFHTFYKIGSEEARKTMIAFSNDIRHRIYRELDPRRYSMYFSRWKAYEMMLMQEKSSGRRYDWVIHTRFDVAWASPTSPYTTFSKGMIYSHNTWMTEVPDTFAILSRNISDIYFSLETIMHPYGFCLGGPNFNYQVLLPTALQQRGYSDQDIEAINREDCRVKFPSFGVTHDSATNISWSMAGVSEYILSRALEKKGYDMLGGGIELRPFFMFIVRYPFEPVCFYLGTNYMLGLSTNRAHPFVIPMLSTCIILEHQLKKYAFVINSSSATSTSSSSSSLSLTCRPSKDVTFFHEVTITPGSESCLLDESITDMNFMPFRIRSRSGLACLSSRYYITPYHLNMSTCLNYMRVQNKPNLVEKYLAEQMFYFYPLLSTPQKIIQHTEITNDEYCLTVLPSSDAVGMDDIIRLTMKPCNDYSDTKHPSKQMFVIENKNDMMMSMISTIQPLSRNRGIQQPSRNYLKPVTNAMIKWQHINADRDSEDSWYCLIIDDNKPFLARTRIWNTSAVIDVAPVYLKKCKSVRNLIGLHPLSSILHLERTRVTGKPFRNGISI